MENYNKRGTSVLGFSMKRGRLDVLEKRLKMGADPNSTYFQHGDRRSLLELAFRFENMDVVKMLVKYGADPNIVFSCGYNLVHYFTRFNEQHLEYVLSIGVDPNTCAALTDGDCPDLAALHIAAQENNVPVMKTLLSNGALINLKGDFYGLTPLHAAMKYPRKETINFLLDNGADLDAVNYFGQTPLQYCLDYLRDEAQEILSSRMQEKLLNVVGDLGRANSEQVRKI